MSLEADPLLGWWDPFLVDVIEIEQEQAISPLYDEYYEEEVLDKWPQKVKE